MLDQVPKTIAAQMRDFPEWHHGREQYAVWVIRCDKSKAIQETFDSARDHLHGYLLEPYRRQPHITVSVCGFLEKEHRYNDDFTQEQLEGQIRALNRVHTPPFEIEIGGINSFASAPFLDVHDPDGGICALRDVLSRSANEFRTVPYRAHLTIGLYAGAYPRNEIEERLATFSSQPVRWMVTRVTLVTFQAKEFAGKLSYRHHVELNR